MFGLDLMFGPGRIQLPIHEGDTNSDIIKTPGAEGGRQREDRPPPVALK